MQKKCRRCGELFTPVDGEFYCEKCGGTAAVAMPDERTEITVPETKICTIREAREKADIDKKVLANELKINVATYYNYESKGYMPKKLFLQFCEIVSMPPEQIKCREPMKPFRPKCVTKHKNPAGFTPKSVPEVKQVVSESVESVNKAFPETTKFPQDSEDNEYRYLDAAWLDEMAKGLTAGVIKHPGETWHNIPANEHLARAFRHINLMRMGDRSDNHIINASMRLMMAFAVNKQTQTKEGLTDEIK